MEPLLSGIFAGDADALSAEAAFPQLVARERQDGSLTGGAAISREPGPAFRSFRRGMAQYPAALVDRLRRLGVDLVSGAPITRMERQSRGFQLWSSGGSWAADGVILALPPRAAGRVVADVVPEWVPVLNAWPTASVANLTLAFDEGSLPGLPGGSGFVAPRGSGLPFSATTWLSRKWPDRAPLGQVLVRVYFGGAKNPHAWELPEDELVNACLDFLGRFRPTGRPNPLWHRVIRWKDAFAQPNLGHAGRHHVLAQGGEGIVLAGGYFGGVGIPDCLARADEAAQLVKNYLFQGESAQ
jgi:oxygen-dependent protoporphyrinogen oxidase